MCFKSDIGSECNRNPFNYNLFNFFLPSSFIFLFTMYIDKFMLYTLKAIKEMIDFTDDIGIEGIKHWELIVVGAGIAGLTTGIYGARCGLETLILEEKIPGGSTAEAPRIDNYPGFPNSIRGIDLIERLVQQAGKMGAEIHHLEKVTKFHRMTKEILVWTNKEFYITPALILATGTNHQKLGVLGEEKFHGRGVSYCAVCDGPFFKEMRVIVVGGGNSAAVSALHLSNLASDVKMIHRRNQLRTEDTLLRDLRGQGVDILWETEVKEIKGDDKVKSVTILNKKTSRTKEMAVDGVFIQIGEVPNNELARQSRIKLDKNGYIIVDNRQRTNQEGIYAAGDVTTCPVKQIGTAVGQAVIATTDAFCYIKRPYYYKS